MKDRTHKSYCTGCFSAKFIDEKGYEKNENSIPEVIHCSFVGDSVLSTVSSSKTLVKANSQVIIFKKLKSILHFNFFKQRLYCYLFLLDLDYGMRINDSKYDSQLKSLFLIFPNVGF